MKEHREVPSIWVLGFEQISTKTYHCSKNQIKGMFFPTQLIVSDDLKALTVERLRQGVKK